MSTFRTPVVVEPGLLGRYIVVSSPAQALLTLSSRWPDKHSEKYAKAVAVCDAASRGWIPAYKARASFMAAAREARVLVSRDDARRYTAGSVDLYSSV